MAQWDPSLLPELLPIYYKKLFPFTSYFKWLRYKSSGPNYFRNREFSFTLKDDIYLRYKSYVDQTELEKDVRSRCPYKIDIGAVYTCSPKMRDMVRAGEFVAQYKELVFDIDMTDYDDVRYCCSGADICLKCWPLMTIAIKVMHRALTEDFGFKHILWVYSGRRGVHCWVCDEKAHKLSSAARSAIADYLSVVKGGANMKKKVTLKYSNCHPSIRKAVKIISGYFEDYVIKQDLLGTDERYTAIKDLITDERIRAHLSSCEARTRDMEQTTSTRWEVLKQGCLQVSSGDSMPLNGDEGLNAMPKDMLEIILQYVYPRLDVNVSKGVNHLLKSPFCIHPKTGRVCVPIDANKADQFNPLKVPSLAQLTEELGQWSGEGNLLAYKKTSLRPHVELFEEFVKKLTAGDDLGDETMRVDNSSQEVRAEIASF